MISKVIFLLSFFTIVSNQDLLQILNQEEKNYPVLVLHGIGEDCSTSVEVEGEYSLTIFFFSLNSGSIIHHKTDRMKYKNAEKMPNPTNIANRESFKCV